MPMKEGNLNQLTPIRNQRLNKNATALIASHTILRACLECYNIFLIRAAFLHSCSRFTGSDLEIGPAAAVASTLPLLLLLLRTFA